MFSAASIERAVELQKRSYKLLVWTTSAVERGFISFDAAHTYATLPGATYAWLDRHYDDVPANARPSRDDLREFCNLFASYLESSFELVRDPGERRFSPDAHCFCPMCSWLVPIPHLQTKQLSRHDKARARTLQLDVIRALAAELEHPLPDDRAETIVDDPSLRDDLALAAYGRDLLRRLETASAAPSTLALWRRFAWTPQGSPKPDFELRASAILAAERTICARLG